MASNGRDIVEVWKQQLDDAAHLLDEPGHVEITLYANRGKVRRKPTITYHAGPVEFVSPEEAKQS